MFFRVLVWVQQLIILIFESMYYSDPSFEKLFHFITEIDNEWEKYKNKILRQSNGCDPTIDGKIIYAYSSQTGKHEPHDFIINLENNLNLILNDCLNKIKNTINSFMSSELKFNDYIDILEIHIRTIKSSSEFKRYDSLNLIVTKINEIIINSKVIQKQVYSQNLFKNKTGPLILRKEFQSPSFLESLYDILIENELIEFYENSFDDFKYLFYNSKNVIPLRFICKNAETILAISYIKDIFINFDAKKLEDSNMFCTKSGKNISQSTYNTYSTSRKIKNPKLEKALEQLINQ